MYICRKSPNYILQDLLYLPINLLVSSAMPPYLLSEIEISHKNAFVRGESKRDNEEKVNKNGM